MDSLSNPSLGRFLFTEGAFYFKCFIYPRVAIEQGPHVLTVTFVNGINGG